MKYKIFSLIVLLIISYGSFDLYKTNQIETIKNQLSCDKDTNIWCQNIFSYCGWSDFPNEKYDSYYSCVTKEYDLFKNTKVDVNEIVVNTLKKEKNITLNKFDKSKSLLMEKVYNTKENQIDYYCSCWFDSKKNIDSSCGFNWTWTRAKKIEFEHIVPAENFWNNFKEWRDWDKNCIDSKGKSYKGRSCAEKINKEYQFMQSDIYNLIPTVWTLNLLRSNNSYSEIKWEERNYWTCDFELEKTKLTLNWKKQTVTVIEPPDNIKGDVARVYRYMEQVYWYKLISDKQKPLFDIWEIQDPVDSKECEIYKLKKEIQKSPMFILEESCKNFNK